MQELRFVAVSEDGSYAVLAVPGRSGRYILPIDERLRAVALGQTSRLAQYEIEVESPLRPKEIQARIRAGETAEEIADAAGIPIERVRWFEGPVLAERAYIADKAQAGSVRRSGDAAGPGPRLGEIVTERLTAAGSDPAEGQWDSRKRGDGNWQVSLTFPSAGRLHVAEWVFDPRRRHVMPDDDNAARLSLPESELPAAPVPVPGEATVTPIASRLAPAAGMGGAPVTGFPGSSRFRPDKSVIPDRSLGVDRSLVERPAAMPDRAAAGLSDRAPQTPSAPAAPRSGQYGPGQHERPPRAGGHPGYAEFPESAPYRAPEQQDEPRGHDDPASAPGAYRDLVPEPPAVYRDYEYTEPPRPTYREPVGFRAPAAEPTAYRDEYREVREPEAPAYRAPAQEPAYREPEPAAYRAAPPVDDDRSVAPPRRVVFEDPEPVFFDDEPAPAANEAPAAPTAKEPPAQRAEPVQPVEPAPVAAPAPAVSAVVPAPATEPESPTAPAPAETAAVAEEPVPEAAEPAKVEPVKVESAAAAKADSAAAAVAEVPAQAGTAPATAAEAAAVAAEPSLLREEKEKSAPAENGPPAGVEPAEPPAPETKPEPEAKAEPEAEPEPPAKTETPEPKAEAPAEEQTGGRRGAKKNPKGRRSSVPSWDEIMLGSSRQRD